MTFQEIIDQAPHIVQRKLEQLKFLRERSDFHPEPSCFEHIKIVTTRLINTGDLDLVMAGIFHDICKFDTVRMNPKNGFPTSPGHDKWSSKLIDKNEEIQLFITKIGANWETVSEICLQHMRIKNMHLMRPKKQEELRNLSSFNKLQKFTIADNMLISDDVALEQINAIQITENE